MSIGWRWSGNKGKEWERDLVHAIRGATGSSDVGARRILKRLVNGGWLEEATDLDYSEQPEKAWYDGSILWIIRRAARRSGLFPALPPPVPERLSSLLAYEKPIDVTGEGWHAVRFPEPMLTALHANEPAVVAVARHASPARTWAFRSPDDRAPFKAERYFTPTDLTPANPFVSLGDLELVGFDLVTFRRPWPPPRVRLGRSSV